MNSLTFFIFVLSATVASATREGRIINGTQALPGQFPFLVFLENVNTTEQNRQSYGVGALISDRYVLTSAQAVWPPTTNFTLKVRLGAYNWSNDNEPGQVSYWVYDSSIIVHEKYNASSGPAGGYNLAILTLPESVRFTERIQPIDLPSWSEVESTYEDRTGLISGWGFANWTEVERQPPDPAVNYAPVKIWKQQDCQGEPIQTLRSNIRVRTLYYEYGAPLVLQDGGNYKLIAVYTYDRIFIGPESIGKINVYTRINRELEFIERHTNIKIKP